MISPLAYVDPEAQVGENTTIYPFAYIEKDVVIGENCTVMPYASILNGTRMGNGNKVFHGAIVGAIPQDFNFVGEETLLQIGDNNTIREKVVINRATHSNGSTLIGHENFLMEGVHVSHDVKIGNRTVLGYGTKVAGECVIDDCAISSAGVIMHQYCHIGTWSLIQGGCRINKDIPPYAVIAKEPATYHSVNAVVLAHHQFSERVLRHIANAYRLIYQGNISVFDALLKIEEQVPMSEEIQNIIDFIRASKRGIIK